MGPGNYQVGLSIAFDTSSPFVLSDIDEDGSVREVKSKKEFLLSFDTSDIIVDTSDIIVDTSDIIVVVQVFLLWK